MAGFNINAVPMENRTKAQIAAHVEMYKRTQDTCRVHNPTDQDFVVYNDRMVSNESWVIPNQNRDVGFGKGNLDVPRFVAVRYCNKIGEYIISKKSKEDWDQRKMQYRQDEWGEKEERMAIRTNSQEEWDKLMPQLFLGVVKRYQGENMFEQEQKEPEKPTFSNGEGALERLGIADKEFGVSEEDIVDKKQQLINQLT